LKEVMIFVAVVGFVTVPLKERKNFVTVPLREFFFVLIFFVFAFDVRDYFGSGVFLFGSTFVWDSFCPILNSEFMNPVPRARFSWNLNSVGRKHAK
jgi:hypothetical protein